jgi:hypothetical protein
MVSHFSNPPTGSSTQSATGSPSLTYSWPAEVHSPSVRLEQVSLDPTSIPESVVVCPTLNRWGSDGQGSLPRMLRSVCQQGAPVLINDATADPESSGEAMRQRIAGLRNALQDGMDGPVFVMTPELQGIVAARVIGETKLDEKVVRAVLMDTGYASQRAKLDVLLGGLVLAADRSIKALTLDDDTVVPPLCRMLKKEYLEKHQLSHRENSQTIVAEAEFPGDHCLETRGANSVVPLFEHLGVTVGDLRESGRPLPFTREWTDTMHSAIQVARKGEPRQFVVAPGAVSMDEIHPNASEAVVVAAFATKHHLPDYRTVKFLWQAVQNGFPETELPFLSFPSGPSSLFAFLGCTTNVDSAALARQLDEKTVFWPWWFVSSDEISRNNPLQTVTGHYRADNELLPVLLERINAITDNFYTYLAGVDTQIEHYQARTGYRPNIVEQTTASLVGNIAALEACRRLEFVRDTDTTRGHFFVRVEDTRKYKAPREHVESVFEELKNIDELCFKRMTQQDACDDFRDRARQKKEYESLHESLNRKTADFDFDRFYAALSKEVAGQLKFFGQIVEALPVVIDQLKCIIKAGDYPVLKAVCD